MRNLTIFIDMDGTIEKLIDPWLERLNKKYNKSIGVEEIKAWDIGKAYPDLSSEEIMNELDDSIWDEVMPMENAVDVIKRIIDKGHHVFIVTSTPYQSIRSKMDNLLFKWFPYLTWDNVIITNNKQLLLGDVMVDDALHNLIGGNYKKILFDAPYNRNIDDEKYQLIRTKDWLEIEEILNNMANEEG